MTAEENNGLEEQFKMGMQLLAASTNLITTVHEGERSGMAATAVTSLTAEPPTLLVCANQTSRTYGSIVEAGKFAVNIVPDDMTDLVGVFSSKMDKEEQFRQGGTWKEAANGMPLLEEAVGAFSCRVEKAVEAWTHVVFFGVVEEIHLNTDKLPLIYAKRGFYGIKEL